MIAKIITYDNEMRRSVNLYEVDKILTQNIEHPYGCGCDACLSLKNEQTEEHKCSIILTAVSCYKIVEYIPLPDGTKKAHMELLAQEFLGKHDICYLLNDNGQTIEKII